jgi:all-trans-retinol 13,14-reductase
LTRQPARRAADRAEEERCDMPDRFRTLDRDAFDAIVVGAGLGGLTAAAILARRGARVLVVDRHYVAGGNATVFKRRGYEFDVGLHYIGGCGPHGVVPGILRAAGADEIEFEEMDPDGLDTLVFPGLTFRVPRGIPAFRRRLLEHFPGEKRGIDRYLSIVEPLARLQSTRRGPREMLPIAPKALMLLRWAGSTYGAFLDSCTKNERLRAVLAGQSGDYALPPSRASTVIGAGLVAHYVDGAYFPKGGGQVPSDRLAEAIERHGGKILLRTSARHIAIERGRVVGVEIENKHFGVRFVRAPVVISNADLKQTMDRLVGAAHLKRKTVVRTGSFEMAPALGVVYIGLRRDLRAEGHPATNYWIHPSYDIEAGYAAVARGEILDSPFAFISIASLKDPTNPRLAPPGVTNLQVMGVTPSSPAAWGVTEEQVQTGAYSKSEEYQRRKLAFGDSLIEYASRVFPGIRDEIAYCEVATPLTHRRFTSATAGTSYGIAATPGQYLWNRPPTKTEIDGLYLCGASCRTGPGIVGALISGAVAAAAVSRSRGDGHLLGLAGTGAERARKESAPETFSPDTVAF